MVHTVGVIGVNGNVGLPTTQQLIKAAAEDKIRLVIFHRSGSNLDSFTIGKNVETKVLNLDDPAEKIEAGVKGINVFISALGVEALVKEANLVDALAKSPDVVTFVPSAYSIVWQPEDHKDPYLGPILKNFHGGWERAKEKKIGTTIVYTGAFDKYWFGPGFLESSVKGNAVLATKTQLQHGFPITALKHLGAAIARIATADPQSIKDHEYSVVTFRPTGQEILDLYTKINGSQAQVKNLTDEEKDAARIDVANFGPAKAAYWDRWERDEWGYESEGRISDNEYGGPGLEELAREFA